MAHRFKILVEVEVERTQGLFAARDEMVDQIVESIESADPGSLSGIGANGDSEYDVLSWEVSEA
jgi:hypothetical protein